MIELNLLPDIKKEYIRAQRNRTRVALVSMMVIAGSLGLVAVGVVYTYVAQKAIIGHYDGEIAKKTKILEQKPNTTLNLTLQNQLAALPKLHEEKIIYSRVMDMLPILNPGAPNMVSLNNMTLDDSQKTMVLNGRCDTFEALSVFQESLKHAQLTTYTIADDGSRVDTNGKLFDQVVIESSSLGLSNNMPKVSFSIRTHYNELTFSNAIKGIEVKVPQLSAQSADDNKRVFEGS